MNPTSRIRKPPGYVFDRLAQLAFPRSIYFRVFAPIAADLSEEYRTALDRGNRWLATLVVVRGYLGYVLAALTTAPVSLVAQLYRLVRKPAKAVRPSGPVEELLARLGEEVLRVDHIDAEKNFFALGMDSLLAIQLLSRIREVFEIEVQVADLFRGPTIRSLAARIKVLRRSWGVVAPPNASLRPQSVLRLRRFAEQLFSPEANSTVFSPTLDDLEWEYSEAVAEGRKWRMRWVWIRGYWSFLAAVRNYLVSSIGEKIRSRLGWL